jgi:ATP phosphoribosyltransferase regulatory subunit HisZ
MSDKREDYIRKLEAKLDECDARLDKLAAEAAQADEQTKTKYYKQMEELREKRKDVEQEIQDLIDEKESVWDDLKQGIDNSWSTWKQSFTKAKSEFERAYKEGRKE